MIKSMFLLLFISPSLLISPIMAISMNSWFSMWMSIEFNLMTFIPFLIYNNNNNKELSMKYFIVQIFSSTLLLISSNPLNFIFFTKFKPEMILLLNLSLIIKLGMSPFHNWYINIMNNLNWLNCLIISTWQKIIPLFYITNLFNMNYMIFTILISNIFSIFALNHQSIRMMMAYSSLNHFSWIMLSAMMNINITFNYFLIYTMLMISITLFFNFYNIYFINQMNLFNHSKLSNFFITMNFLSLSGLPPFLGFYLKLMIMELSIYSFFYIINFMTIISIISFIYYTRIILMLIMNFKKENKMNNIILFNNLPLNKMMLMLSIFNLWMFLYI